MKVALHGKSCAVARKRKSCAPQHRNFLVGLISSYKFTLELWITQDMQVNLNERINSGWYWYHEWTVFLQSTWFSCCQTNSVSVLHEYSFVIDLNYTFLLRGPCIVVLNLFFCKLLRKSSRCSTLHMQGPYLHINIFVHVDLTSSANYYLQTNEMA